MPISALDTIPVALRHTSDQAFKRFSFGQWNRLALVGLLAGELGSSGGCNFAKNYNIPHHPGTQHLLDPSLSQLGIDPAALAGIIAVLVVSGLILGLLFMYVSSVMRFILFDSVVAKECHIRQGWSRRQSEGIKYFLFKLAYSLVTIGGIGLVLGVPALWAFLAGWLRDPKQHLAPLVVLGVMVFFALLFFGPGNGRRVCVHQRFCRSFDGARRTDGD